MSSLWWDAFRSSRILNQNFGLALDPEDVLTPLTIPLERSLFISPAGYLRPWRSQASAADTGSVVTSDKDKFLVNLDVQHFTPEEIKVTSSGKTLTVEGKHEEKLDEHGFISRHFVRRYILPDGLDVNKIQSSLSSDGVLTISAPRKVVEDEKEKTIPVQQTGQPIKPVQIKREEVPKEETNPEETKKEESKEEESKSEQNKQEESEIEIKKEEIKLELTKAGESNEEETKNEESKTAESGKEEIKLEEYKTEESKTEEIVKEEITSVEISKEEIEIVESKNEEREQDESRKEEKKKEKSKPVESKKEETKQQSKTDGSKKGESKKKESKK